MVSDGRTTPAMDPGVLAIRIDGRQPPSAESVAAIGALCDSAEDGDDPRTVVVRVSGAPDRFWTRDLNVALVSKWERGLRRLERLPAATIGVASGDCGGPALDALLATDYRIADASLRLVVPVTEGATWPGMALYRLSRQTGGAAVRRSLLLGVPIDAAEALALRLVDELADDAEDAENALAAAAGLTGAFAGAEVAIRRQLMIEALSESFEDALGRHLAACDRALRRASIR
jgi:isomerase DpgB